MNTREPGEPPPDQVVRAFAGSAQLSHLPGGEGHSWRAGDVVLKRGGDEQKVAWLAGVLAQVGDRADFRVARHRAADDGRFVVDGWSASEWVEGEHASGRWDDVVTVSSAFHAALAATSPSWPDFMKSDTSPWAVGARVAWGEEPRPDALPDSVGAVMERLEPMLNEPWDGEPAQLIHGDLTSGNVLFADAAALPPAVIDFSAHFCPAPFSVAVAIADAIAWEDAPPVLAVRFATTTPQADQLLARAVAFRLVAASKLWADYGARIDAEVDGYRRLLPLIAAS